MRFRWATRLGGRSSATVFDARASVRGTNFQIKLVAELVQHHGMIQQSWVANHVQARQVRRVHDAVKRFLSNRLEVDQFQTLKTTGA
jgi:hypothetical protein